MSKPYISERFGILNPWGELWTDDHFHTEGVHREHEQHRLFAELRRHGEWFHPGAPLLDHIGRLQTQCVLPDWANP